MNTHKKIFKNFLFFGLLSLGLKAFAFGTMPPGMEESSVNPTLTKQQILSAIPVKDLQRLATVVAEIKKYYIKDVDDSTLFNNAINGMLSGLDPHSEYLTKDDLQDLELVTVGKFSGIGIEVAPDSGMLKVISPIDDTPAAKAGIKAGDYILQIDNKFVRNMTLKDAVKQMRGTSGSKVTLTILRKDATKPLNIVLKREVIKVQSVKSKLLDSNYGYVRIAFFQDATDTDVLNAINKLKHDAGGNLKGLILDLRNNPGGLLDASVKVAGDFLDSHKLGKNNLIVYTNGHSKDNGSQITAKATPGELLPNVPIVVLINEGSASASEVVAGALQDHKRAILVGNKTFGKGSVQTLLPVDNENAVKITTALYYTPNGRSIQAKGIEPDIYVANVKIPEKTDNSDAGLDAISEASLSAHLQNGDGDSDDAIAEQNTLQEKQQRSLLKLAREDYQLYEALNVLKGMSVMNVK
jgi:carboxyl-terminal processing protease